MVPLSHQVFVGAADVCACSSARTPRPVALRQAQAGCSRLPLRAARYQKSRPTALSAVPEREVAARAAAGEVLPKLDLDGPQASGNGNGQPKQPQLAQCTLAVHGGENHGRLRPGVADALTTPIVQTSTYTFHNTEQLIGALAPRAGGMQALQ